MITSEHIKKTEACAMEQVVLFHAPKSKEELIPPSEKKIPAQPTWEAAGRDLKQTKIPSSLSDLNITITLKTNLETNAAPKHLS